MILEFDFAESLRLRLDEEKQEAYCSLVRAVLEEAESSLPFFQEFGEGEIYISFVADAEMRQLNRDQRQIDRTTDVLSFPLLTLQEGRGKVEELDRNPENGAVSLGDIVVSLDKMQEQAAEYGHSEERELSFLVCHGFFHLMGFDHRDVQEESRMIAQTETVLTKMGYGRKEE